MIGSLINALTVLCFAAVYATFLGHGLFFPGCLIMPMAGMFLGHDGSTSSGGVIALEIWCLYFLPIGILAYLHFKRNEG